MTHRRRRNLHNYLIQMGNLCSKILNVLAPIGMKIKSRSYGLPYWYHPKISHLIYPMNIFKNVSSSFWRHISSKKATQWLLGEILFLQILKREIGQGNKVEERLVPLGLLNKTMPHVFWRKMFFLWKRMLYWVFLTGENVPCNK